MVSSSSSRLSPVARTASCRRSALRSCRLRPAHRPQARHHRQRRPGRAPARPSAAPSRSAVMLANGTRRLLGSAADAVRPRGPPAGQRRRRRLPRPRRPGRRPRPPRRGNGLVTISTSRPPNVAGVSGQGSLCTLTFKAIAAGDSNLALVKVGAQQRAGQSSGRRFAGRGACEVMC